VELPGHVEHAAGPGESLYLPSSHAVHVPPLGPVYPAMHAQSPVASLAAFTCAQMHTHTHTHVLCKLRPACKTYLLLMHSCIQYT
jgi:hypothetical protein